MTKQKIAKMDLEQKALVCCQACIGPAKHIPQALITKVKLYTVRHGKEPTVSQVQDWMGQLTSYGQIFQAVTPTTASFSRSRCLDRPGWKDLPSCMHNTVVAVVAGWEKGPARAGKPIFFMMAYSCWHRKTERDNWQDGPPAFTSDLNAMHEAEKTLPDAFHRRRYYQLLDVITGDQWSTIVATAEQRAEAFYMVMTKYWTAGDFVRAMEQAHVVIKGV